MKTENIVPAVKPVVFVRDRAFFDMAEVLVVYLPVELADKYKKRTALIDKIARPAFCDVAVKMAGIDRGQRDWTN